MKKFLTFLMLLSTLCLSAIAADINVNRLYHVTCQRGAWTYDGGQMKGATADTTDVKQQFAFVLYGGNKYLWSQAAQHFIATDGVAKSILEASPIQWEDLGDGTFRFFFSDDKNINLTQGMVLIDEWNEADEGNIMTLTPVEGFSSSTVMNVLKYDISKKTYTFHITGAPEGSNAKVTYNDTLYAGEETVEAVVITPAELTATDIAGYTYSITIDGTNVNVNYTALPFIQGQTYTLTLRGKSLVYDPSTGLMKTDVAATGDDAYFILNGNSADGFTFFSVAANKYFQVQDETADNAKAYAVAETEADATRYDYVGYEGGFTFKIHGTPNNYINERDKAFSTWNSGWGMNDAGGKLTFTIVEEEPVADIPFTVGKKYVVWFNNSAKQYFWEDKDGVANEIRCADGDINTRDELESYSSTVYWTMGGNATNGYTFTNVATGKSLVAPATLSAGAAFLLSDSEATGFDVVKMDNGYYRFYIHGQTTYYLAHTSRSSHLVAMYNVADYGLTTDGGASVVQFEEIPDHYDYTLTLVDAPEGAVVTIGGEARANGAKFTSNGRINSNDITVQVEGYTYSIDITTSEVTITFTKIPYTAGKKYVISSVGHANEAVYYLTNDGTNTALAVSTEYPAATKYWTAESVKLNEDGSLNVSFTNGGKYLAFMATTDEEGHAVKLSKFDVDDPSFVNIQDYLKYYPDHESDERFLYFAVKDDNGSIAWGQGNGTSVRTAGYSYQFKVEEIAEEEPVQYTEGDFYVKNVKGGEYFGFVGTTLSDGNFGPVAEANKLVCTVTQPEAGTFNIQLQGFNYVSCGSNGGFSNNKAANALKLFKVNGTVAEEVKVIEEGAEYLIVGTKNSVYYAISNGTNGKTGADLRTTGVEVANVKGHILEFSDACKWTFEPYVNTDTREALNAVYIKNGEGKYFAIGGEGDDVNLLDEGQTWNIAPVAVDPNAYTLENAELDATKRYINSGTNGYTSKGEDYNARDIFFYELTNAATGECTLVAQPELGKTYAMVVQNVTTSYAGYYVIYSGLAKDKNNRGDVIALNVAELPTTLTIDATLSSSNGTITPAKAFWTLTDTAEEPEPEPIFVEGTPITAIEEFTDGATVYLQDAKFSKYIVNATTVADAADVNCYIKLEQVAENTFRLKLSNGKYLSYDPETIGNDAPAYDEEDQAKATVYTVVAQGNYWRFQFAFAEDATAEQTYNIVGGSAPIITWNKPDGAVRRNFTVYKVPSEEPEPTFPEEGKAYKFQEISSEMFLNVIPDSEDNKKDVVLKKAPQALYFTAVEGGYTITTEDGLYVGGFSNGWNMSSKVPQTWVVEEVEGGYAFRTLESVGGAAMYIGFDTVENEGAAAFRNKDYSAYHGIFAITDFSAPILSAKEKLEAAIADAGAVKTEGLPSDLVEALTTAVENGNQTLANTEATDADYDKARLAIEKAISNIKNYTPQSDEEMFADLTATLAAAGNILTLNKVEGGLDEQNEYVISSTVAGVVGYKPYDNVFNIGEACAVTQYIIELAGNDAATLALICATQDMTIRDLTVEIQALIDAYNEAEVLLPEKDKTYIIRLAPDQYSWALTLDETEAGEKALNTVSYSEISGSLSKDNAWTCMGQEEYVIVNSQLEAESLGMRLRFTSASQPELYLGWKTVTTSATEWNTYWQISGKNAAVYGYLTMQAYDGANHYKYLTTNALTGALNHSDTPFWVENSEFSSSYIFEEVDPASLDEGTVGVGTVIRNNASGQRYNLQGQRIGKNQRGINLVGGKKLLIK